MAEDDLSDEDLVPKKKVKIQAPLRSNVTQDNVFLCTHCSKKISFKHNLKRHLTSCTKNPKLKSALLFTCPSCDSTFSRKDSFNVHGAKCSSGKLISRQRKSKCSFFDCDMVFFHKSSLICHLKNVHGAPVKDTILKQFSCMADFLKWKDQEEVQTYSNFVQQSDELKGIHYFYCQRDGHSKAHRKSEEMARKSERKNRFGQIKTDALCISRMKVVKNSDNSVSVSYEPTHSHPLNPKDYRHHPPTHSANTFINHQVSMGVPAIEIHRSLQPESFNREKREESIAFSRDCVNSKKSIQLRCAKKRTNLRLHKDEATSTYLLCRTLQTEKYNPVVLYKPVGQPVEVVPEEINYLPGSEEIFLFGLQTKEQMELMVEGSKKILVVDDTHNCTQYENFKLLNVLVVGASNKRQPCAHLITNRTDQETLKFFFLELKSRSGEMLHINCVITDDAPCLINAMEIGFQLTLRHE